MKVILDFGKMDNVNEHFLTFSALGTTWTKGYGYEAPSHVGIKLFTKIIWNNFIVSNHK
jgi:hypothetical protein